jgi:putative heme utilization carrier protein HutX
MTTAVLDDLASYMRDNPGAVIEDVARERAVTPRAVLEALPAEMVTIVGGDNAFVTAMQDIAGWGEVTLIIHTDDGIFEITAPVSEGQIGHGYFNLMNPKGLHGHLRHTRCGGVAFVERPFMGKPSAFVAFLNVDGGVMFKVFVGRDESRALKADQLERFRALAGRLRG